MTKSRLSFSLPQRLTSRRGAWVSLVIVLLAVVALFGVLSSAQAPAGNSISPANSESAQVKALADQFPGSDEGSVLIVATHQDGAPLTEADLSAVGAMGPGIDATTGHEASRPISSDDKKAAVIQTSITLGDDNSVTAQTVKDLRTELAENPIEGISMQVTGGSAFGADIAASFEGADFTLLLVTIGIVAVLLIITYRSPVLWLIPLVVVALADRIAGLSTDALGSALGLEFDAGIISVLVFGAGTNYALLLISRYREELLHTEDHRLALANAWRGTAPAVLASNVTVVLSLATLVLAVIPGTRGLGISSAVGLIIALVAVLGALPPLLAVCGRGLFWPFVPRPGNGPTGQRMWGAIASRVVRRPVVALLAGGALLAIMATGLFGTSIGLTQTEKFRVASESASGLETLGEHFPAGESQPMIVIAKSQAIDQVRTKAEDTTGVVRVTPLGESTNGELGKLMVTGEPGPGTPESLALVEELRTAVHSVSGAEAMVGGAVAEDADARTGNMRDLLLIAPLVLAVSFIVLLVLLRSIVAPALLLVVNMVSALAAIGAGSWLSHMLFGQDALDLQVPLLAFLFLVALGIDYTIFLVHRARSEAAIHGTREGMVRAVASTGGVITSAGVVLAAVFAALGMLPLVTLGQLGLIVGLGVLVDTLVVRTVIVPAIFSLLGDRIWWPTAPPHARHVEMGIPSTDAQEGESSHGTYSAGDTLTH
ncbi:MMPL family transporter [Paeniglutamicibacter gangotriensis]|uniref:Putative multi-drug/solvent efflux protein n=1 Tax=Paeniglutamicibacter gangotriensis Lz1y TaxID=1276920 RepID=M7NNL2_9MICC|nr:MMPL family transporter [Paeniglutamicibacter gangotriensis]EMR00144.1 putative multi-drug/solvent efflux protein [Paeniglutamicibacter gangotriensis Lz1y]